jgi:hypothetical protein
MTDVDDVDDGFRLLTMEGAALRGAPWTARNGSQVSTGSAFSTSSAGRSRGSGRCSASTIAIDVQPSSNAVDYKR